MSPEYQSPRLIPVLDVMGGVVVHAVGGRRDDYQPLKNNLTFVCDPETVLQAFQDQMDPFEVYIADLDAIRGSGEISPALRRLIERNRSLVFWVDAGLRSFE